MRKKSFLFLFLLFILTVLAGQLNAQAADTASPTGAGPFGVGIMLGEPTGIVAKYWFNRLWSVDGAFAWSFTQGGFFYTHADLLYNIYNILESQNFSLPVYVGVGARLLFGGLTLTNNIFGIRIPVGVNFILRQLPVDLFVEVAPGIDLIPDSNFSFGGGVGARYYF